MTTLELDPTTQKIVDDFDLQAKKRAVELLFRIENEPLQATREIAFCLGYKAGVVDLGAAMREEAVVDVARMAAVFAAARAWRDSPRVDASSLAGTVNVHEAQLIAAVDATMPIRLSHNEGNAMTSCHVMQGPPGWRCSCGTAFDDYYTLAEHIRQFINCPRCGADPTDLGEGELYRWQCGHWIARNDAPASIRAAELAP